MRLQGFIPLCHFPMTFVYADQGEECSVSLVPWCRCPFLGSSCTAFTEALIRTANETTLLLDLMVW